MNQMSNILQKIEATKFQEVERLKVHVSLNEIKEHNNLNDAMELAVKSIQDGNALNKLKELVKESNE